MIPCTVCLQRSGGQGSGVIVSSDGLILTAGHVSGTLVGGNRYDPENDPGNKVVIILANGKRVRGVTLGYDPRIDTGMVKITEKGEYPYTEVVSTKDLKVGDWVITLGHPGGIHKDRPPVVRVGKIGNLSYTPPGETGGFLQTDCALVGGDSGGPLFDMHGRVIGIHSRIGDDRRVGPSIAQNMDVPSDRFLEEWDGLVKGQVLSVSPYLGVTNQEGAKNCKLGDITPNSPAARGGLKSGDVVLKFGGKDVGNYDEFVKFLEASKPVQEITLEVKRGDQKKEIKVKLGWR